MLLVEKKQLSLNKRSYRFGDRIVLGKVCEDLSSPGEIQESRVPGERESKLQNLKDNKQPLEKRKGTRDYKEPHSFCKQTVNIWWRHKQAIEGD